jgi:hypothetical protein
VINPTYSQLSKDEKEKIHVEPFASAAATPAKANSADEIVLKDIDYAQVNDLVKQSNKKLKWVLLYTSGCSGTPYILPYVKATKDKYGDDVDIFLLASDDYATTNSVKKKLFHYGINFQTYIINNSYGEFKDNRKKGYQVRNELCTSCKEDMIGVPYNVVFNSKNEIVFTKYRSYKTVNDSLVGDDFIGKLYTKETGK